MGVEGQESEGFVSHSGRTGKRQIGGEGRRTLQGKKRPHAKVYTGELIHSMMGAGDYEIQEYVFEERASTQGRERDRVRKTGGIKNQKTNKTQKQLDT